MSNFAYNWAFPFGPHVNIDPNLVGKELERIKNIYGGTITPRTLVFEAQNEESILHQLFEWNNEKAGPLYRLQQARRVINNIQVTVVKNDGPINIDVYEVVSKNGDGYKSFDTFTSDDIDYIKYDISTRLSQLRDKLALYRQFDDILSLVNTAIDIIKK